MAQHLLMQEMNEKERVKSMYIKDDISEVSDLFPEDSKEYTKAFGLLVAIASLLVGMLLKYAIKNGLIYCLFPFDAINTFHSFIKKVIPRQELSLAVRFPIAVADIDPVACSSCRPIQAQRNKIPASSSQIPGLFSNSHQVY